MIWLVIVGYALVWGGWLWLMQDPLPPTVPPSIRER